jgi:hypothetical protein
MIVTAARGGVVLEFASDETELLALLARQLEQLIDEDAGAGGSDDPLMDRLFPAGYRDDADAAEEFRQYTHAGLRDYKTAGVGLVWAALAQSARVELDRAEADRWARTLTDLRLMVGTRIGLQHDDDVLPDDLLGEIYGWLTELQGAIIAGLEAGEAQGRRT